ncbi:hypothetical protein MYAM1_000956 [Malassezia yamatoensis]|uniref:Uncharacterized protein n=1 Tax=Malassezia yamatoensis TaxID=253288 RepID=A0AAJ6CHV8_9BASI|nr:hypothetical protein MYAM1_000956 [Malassezia yamatoensis]
MLERANNDAVLRHRHAREVDGMPLARPPQIQVPHGHEGDDYIVLRPPVRPEKSKPSIFSPIYNLAWRIYIGSYGTFGMFLLEPYEQIILLFIYVLLLVGIGIAFMHFPAYLQSMLRRLHYYITGE